MNLTKPWERKNPGLLVYTVGNAERDCEQTTLKTQWADTLMKGLL